MGDLGRPESHCQSTGSSALVSMPEGALRRTTRPSHPIPHACMPDASSPSLLHARPTRESCLCGSAQHWARGHALALLHDGLTYMRARHPGGARTRILHRRLPRPAMPCATHIDNGGASTPAGVRVACGIFPPRGMLHAPRTCANLDGRHLRPSSNPPKESCLDAIPGGTISGGGGSSVADTSNKSRIKESGP